MLSGVYVARHFAINTDIGRLLESRQPWAQRDAAIGKAFPQREQMILAVVQAPALELADAAANELAAALRQQPARFHAVSQPGGGEFFGRNGLLFLDTGAVKETTAQLGEARPCSMRSRAILRCAALRYALDHAGAAAAARPGQLSDMATLLGQARRAVEGVLAHRRPPCRGWACSTPTCGRAPTASRAASSRSVRCSTTATWGRRRGLDGDPCRGGRSRLAERFGAEVRLTAAAAGRRRVRLGQRGAALNGALTVLAVILIL